MRIPHKGAAAPLYSFFYFSSRDIFVTTLDQKISVAPQYSFLIFLLHLWSRRLEQSCFLFAVCPVALRLYLLKDVLDDEWVDVLGDLVEQQEVAESLKGTVIILDKTSMDDILAHLTVCSCMDNIHSHLMGDDGEEPVDEPDARDCCQKNKPEVEKYVDLLVDDVKGENTECVVLLKRP